jgi:hypothetical protein
MGAWAIPALAAGRSPKVKLVLVMEKEEYRLSEPIELQFKLVNADTEPVFVNTRFKAGTPSAEAGQRELVVEVRQADGREVPSKIRDYPTGLPKTEDFHQLEPGGEFLHEKKWNLKDVFEITQPGIYRVTAIYENVYGAEIGLNAFRGPARAEKTFKVVE